MATHFVMSTPTHVTWCCCKPTNGLDVTTDWQAATCPDFPRLAHLVYVDTPAKRAAVRRIYPQIILDENGDYSHG